MNPPGENEQPAQDEQPGQNAPPGEDEQSGEKARSSQDKQPGQDRQPGQNARNGQDKQSGQKAPPGRDPRPRPTGVWFGVDVGSVRVGVARSDPRGVLAVPVATLRRDRRLAGDLDELNALLIEHEAAGVVVGLPRTLAGRSGPAVQEARDYGRALAARIAPRPVVYVDERLTTVLAQRNLASSGVRGRASRSVVDQAAAVEILQSFLDGSTQQHLD